MADQRLCPGSARAVEQAFEEYANLMEAAPLKKSTKYAYITHAQRFVRWLNGVDVIPRRSEENGS